MTAANFICLVNLLQIRHVISLLTESYRRGLTTAQQFPRAATRDLTVQEKK